MAQRPKCEPERGRSSIHLLEYRVSFEEGRPWMFHSRIVVYLHGYIAFGVFPRRLSNSPASSMTLVHQTPRMSWTRDCTPSSVQLDRRSKMAMLLFEQDVKFLQRFLKSAGLYNSEIDGIRGPKTSAA